MECKKCGGCCGPVPITLKEKLLIEKYIKIYKIKVNRNIFDINKINCQFLNINKTCMIYEVRPYICKNFMCNVEFNNLNNISNLDRYIYMLSDIEV